MVRKDSSSSELRYTCDQPGCSKSYSRPDHLLRHKLNHDQARVLCCNQCDRTFVRQDLLVRHLERHALRGKTLGRWSNRHKDGDDDDAEDASGSSLSPSKSGDASQKRRKSNSASDLARSTDFHRGGGADHDIGSDKDEDADHFHHLATDDSAAQSGSRQSIQSRYRDDPTRPLPSQPSNLVDPVASSAWPSFASAPLTSPSALPPANTAPSHQPPSSWSSNAPMSPPTQRPSAAYATAGSSYRPVSIAPSDVARPPASNYAQNTSSLAHPAPYNSTSYPDDSVWSAEHTQNSLRADPIVGTEPVAATQAHAPFRWMPTPADALSTDPSNGSYAPPPSASYLTAWGDANTEASRDLPLPMADLDTTSAVPSSARPPSSLPLPNQDIFPFAPPNVDHTADYGWLFDGVDPFGGSNWGGSIGRPPTSGSNARGPHSQASAFSPSSSDGLGGFLGNMHGSQNGAASVAGAGDASSFGRGMSSDGVLMSGSEVETPNALEDLAYFASLQADIPSRVTFHLDPVAHHRLLIFLQSVSELPNSPLFTPSALRCYIYLFFVKFNRLYPLIHEPTFAASTTDPMLLSAIVVIGAHFAGLPAHELAVRIAQKIWGAVVSLEDFRPARATLPMLQALVLTESFGKMMSTRPQHEMAHLFHNFIITLARRNAVFNASSQGQTLFDDSEESWRSWAREEEKKRIALFEFMLDAQHATIFRHIPSLSAFQIQLHLPCSDEEWSKTTPEAWYRHRKRTGYKPPGPFIPALKACLSPAKTPQELDAFPRFVLLHGLMSIAYDLQWKQNVLLGAETSPGGSKTNDGGIGNWKDRLSAAYSSLQARMDIAYIKADEDTSARLIHRATPSLVTAAQIALFADIIDIQIYAGLPSVLGRFIDRATFNASRRSVKEWARTSDGRTAVWYAVNFLRTSFLGTGTESYGTIQTFRNGGAPSSTEDSRGEGTAPYPGLRDQESSAIPIGGPAGRKGLDHESGLDEVLHHRWCQYLCALVVWAYGHALTIPRSGPPGDALASAGRAGPSSAAHSARPGSAQRNGSSTLGATLGQSPGALHGQVSAERTPIAGDLASGDATSASASAGAQKPEGVDFLERMSTKTADDIAFVDCKCYTRAVLEMVEREVRASRWELGREASGVLRKLISNHSLPVWVRSSNLDGSSGPQQLRRNELSSLTIQQHAKPLMVKDDPDGRSPATHHRTASTGSPHVHAPATKGPSSALGTATAGSPAPLPTGLPSRGVMASPSSAGPSSAGVASSSNQTSSGYPTAAD